jgi:acyl-CoA thioester hydrolase
MIGADLSASDRQVLAKAETLWVYVDGRTGRPQRIPGDIRSQFDVVDDEAAVLARLEK